jgi:aminoglycoside phosphotransferase (APT) family kinase protein
LDSLTLQTALDRLAPRLVSNGKVVQGLTRLSGGASQETWRFEVLDQAGHTTPLILRRSPHTGPRNGEALPLLVEAEVMERASAAGIVVPAIVHRCATDDGLGEAFIMDFVPGETVARKILRDETYTTARTQLTCHVGKALAAIHALPLNDVAEQLPLSNGQDQLTRYEAIYRGFGVNRPVLELAIQWLHSRLPKPVAPTLVHGDFRLGNFIVDTQGLAAVLDWELCHIGDPREDVGWICVNSWRFGHREKAVGGFGDLRSLLDAYQAFGGMAFAREDIKWFQALGSLKWGIMCLIMYEAFRSGADPSIERAMIGRRTSEAEIDLLNLMEGRDHA